MPVSGPALERVPVQLPTSVAVLVPRSAPLPVQPTPAPSLVSGQEQVSVPIPELEPAPWRVSDPVPAPAPIPGSSLERVPRSVLVPVHMPEPVRVVEPMPDW